MSTWWFLWIDSSNGVKIDTNIFKYRFLTLLTFDLKSTLKFKIEGGIHPNLLPNDINNRSSMDASY